MTVPLSDQQLDKIEAHVPNCRYGCDACVAFPVLAAEVRDLRARIGNARSEIARQDTAATLAMRPGYCDVSDALAAVETHLVDPQHRPATPDGVPAWPLERAFAPDGSLRMVRPAISETGDGTAP